MARRALSASQVNALKKSGAHWCAPHLYVQIRQNGARSWLFRYRQGGKDRWLGLGALKDVPLTKARDQADRLRIQVRDGHDPFSERREAKAAAKATLTVENRTVPTFAWCAEEFIAAHEAGWKSDKHRDQWVSTLKTYAGPVIGRKPVDEVTIEDLLSILQPLWVDKNETASRLRGRIEKVLGWAAAHGYRSTENPAAWQGGALPHLLPPPSRIQKVVHRPAVPYAEVPTLFADLQRRDSISALALRFTILTACRTSEVTGATWEEVDREAKTWSIPSARMKAGEAHVVPLSGAAMAVLEALPGDEGYLFPGSRPQRPISNMAMLEMLRGIRGQGETVHGFRSSFSTWAREQTDHPREIIEASLAHAVGNAVERAYARTTFLDRRRLLMQDWDTYCTGGV